MRVSLWTSELIVSSAAVFRSSAETTRSMVLSLRTFNVVALNGGADAVFAHSLAVHSGALDRLVFAVFRASFIGAAKRRRTRYSNFSRGVSPGIGENFIFGFGIGRVLDVICGHVVESTVSPVNSA